MLSKHLSIFLLIFTFTFCIIFLTAPFVYGVNTINIPPTPAVRYVGTSNDTIQAMNYSSWLHFQGLRGITITGNNLTKTIYFNATLINGTGSGSCTPTTVSDETANRVFDTVYQNLSGKTMLVSVTSLLTANNTNYAQMTAYIGPTGATAYIADFYIAPQTATANLFIDGQLSFVVPSNYYYKIKDESLTSGLLSLNAWIEYLNPFCGSGNPTFNTMENIGTGEASVYAGNSTDVNFQFKTLKQGSGITLINGTNEITISSTGGSGGFLDTMENIGHGGFGFFAGNDTNTNFLFRNLTSTNTNAVITQNTTDVNLAVKGWQNNTGSNLGTHGVGIFDSMLGSVLQFLKVTTNYGLSVTSNSTNAIISLLFKINNQTCTNQAFTSFDNLTGYHTCSYFLNSISNIGHGGKGVLAGISGSTLQGKNITASTGISVGSNLTDVTITNTSPLSGLTIGNIGHGGKGVLAGISGSTLQGKNITSLRTDLFTISSNNTDVTFASNFKLFSTTCTTDYFISVQSNSSGSSTCLLPHIINFTSFTDLLDSTKAKLYLRFDSTVLDSSGNNNYGVVTGTPTYVTGKVNNAFSFDGSSYVTAQNEAQFDFERTNTFSLAFWVKDSNTGISEGLVAKKTGAGNIGYGIGFNIANSLTFRIVNTAATNEINVQYTTNIRDGTFHHVVVTYDGSSAASGVNYYIDGSLASSSIITNNLSATILNNVAVSVGSYSAGTNKMTGTLDEVYIFNYVLTSGNVSTLYNSGSGLFQGAPSLASNTCMIAKNTITGITNLYCSDAGVIKITALQTETTNTLLPSVLTNATGSPTGVGTTAKMMGLASYIVPFTSSRVSMSVCGQMANSVINDGATVQLYYGTGAAPTNGATVTGTALGNSQTMTSLVAAQKSGFCVTGIATGLTVGTPIWIDVSLVATTAGTATITGTTVVALEV